MPPAPLAEPATMRNDSVSTVPFPDRLATHKHIWVISGPAGCGKTSVALSLQKLLAVPYLEGDEVCSSEVKLHLQNSAEI